jgi:hypothetical protein
MNMKRTGIHLVITAALALSLTLIPTAATAQNSNSNTATGQMKESGTEVGRAGRSMGRNVKHGRVLRGGKHFGKHMGRAGKHFGRSTKKVYKRVVS